MSSNAKKPTKLTMRERREIIFMLLFQMELSKGSLEEVAETATEEFELKTDKYTLNRVTMIDEKSDILDKKITKFSPKRAFSRIATTNVIILRIAFYEILFDDSIPYKVSINEAIELAKKYSDNADKSFINAVLDSFVKSLDSENSPQEHSSEEVEAFKNTKDSDTNE